MLVDGQKKLLEMNRQRENEKMIDVVLLGSGATMPNPNRGVSAAVLRCAGRSILFDCGEGTQVALRREKISPVKIDLIALTHYHGDHIFGLPGLLQTMNCLKREEPLYITGPDGLEEAMAPIFALSGQLDYKVHLIHITNPQGIGMKRLNLKWPAGAWLQMIPTEHRIPSQGYSFLLSRPSEFLPEKAKHYGIPVSMWKQILAADPMTPIRMNGQLLEVNGHIVCGTDVMGKARKGIHVVFSGDTQPCNALCSYAHEADLLIHDATYGENSQEEEATRWGHSTFRQAASIAKEASVKCLWLTHFSQSISAPNDFVMNAKSVFENTVCGYDGLSITLNYEKTE